MTTQPDRGRIPVPNLDDRSWDDLVTQMRALIPQYAPQWTDQSPSDLGITLIELFAWLAEGVIYRLNRTPEKNYRAFLNLLGITRDPATPARTHLTFAPGPQAVLVPAGTQAQTASRDGRPVVAETDEDVVVLPTTLRTALALQPFTGAGGPLTYTDASATLVGPPAGTYLLQVAPGQSVQLCIGFDAAVTDEMGLGIRLYRPLSASDGATLSWSYSRGAAEPLAWPQLPAGAVVDGTEGLRHDGRVGLTVPADWTAQHAAGPAAVHPWTTATPSGPADAVTDARFWLGLRVTGTGPTPLSIGVDRLLFNAAAATTALTVRAPEELGTSTGEPFQVFGLAQRPVYRRPGLTPPYDHVRVQVGTGTPPAWTDWTLVQDLPPGPGQVFRLDPVTAEVTFGNHDPVRGVGHGSIPPAGARVRALTYRYVDSGAAGNVDADRLTVPGTLLTGAQLTGIAGVTNLGAGRDGADEEPLEDTLRRAPEQLKIRDRAVTADDYEFLAREATNDVHVVRCLTPRLQSADLPADGSRWHEGDPWTFGGIVRAPGNVTVVVVPDQGLQVARPEPTPDQIRAVTAYLEPRRDLTAHLNVTGPRYLPVSVSVDLVVWPSARDAGADLSRIPGDTTALIDRFLHPTRGGPDGTGWQVGQAVFTSDLFTAIMPSQDLGYISALTVSAGIPLYHFPPLNPDGTAANYDPHERPFDLAGPGASVRVADYELVCSADRHTVHVTVAPVL